MSEGQSVLEFQFADLAQQEETNTLGMWVFLATEVMLFGALFVSYTIFRAKYPEAFEAGSAHTALKLGACNTGVLLASSLMMALAVRAAGLARRGWLIAFLAATIILGTLFLCIKGLEYWEDYQQGLVPWLHFTAALPPTLNSRHVELFFYMYFAMTGLHAIHMLIGVSVLGVLTVKAARGKYTHPMTEVAGLYWHFVDIVWIFLFPLLYLVGHE